MTLQLNDSDVDIILTTLKIRLDATENLQTKYTLMILIEWIEKHK